MTPTWSKDSSLCSASETPEALFTFDVKRDTTIWAGQ
jgi:hypothetical protein